MIYKWTIIAAIIFAPLWVQAEFLQENDSIGVKTVNGQTMILHRVKQGETLYSLARRYGVRVDDILSVNHGMNKSLKIGELVKIPYRKHKVQTSGSFTSGVAFHVVKPSETLFSISRQYGISIDDLKRWNGLKSDVLSPGMKLAVSNGMPAPEKPAAGISSDRMDERKIHIVKPSETLFSISRQYGVTVQQIRDWNNLIGNTLEIGRKLVVSGPESTMRRDEEHTTMLPAGTVEDKGPEDKQEQKPAGEVQSAATATPSEVRQKESETKNAVSPDRADEDVSIYEPAEKTVERGMAEVIDDASDSRKYLALHRTAPIGTIMQIKNEMNDQIVFVRVVGRIPDTGDNSKILIKISKKAYDRLGALDKRFPVVISYVK